MSADRKSEILTAAGNCFARYGYEKTTLDDIAEIVGINKASFYYYFRNKEAIFAELITREADEFIETTRRTVESITGCREQVLTWITESFRYTRANSILHRLSLDSLRKVRKEVGIFTPYLQQSLKSIFRLPKINIKVREI